MSDENNIESTANQELIAAVDMIKEYTESMLVDLYKAAHANVEASVRCRSAMLQTYRLIKVTRKKLLFYQKDLNERRRQLREKNNG